MTGKIANINGGELKRVHNTLQPGCFYGWVIVTVCIFCKIFKVPGQNNVMSYTVPHLLEDFKLSHAELGGLFSAATIMAGMVQPMLGRTMDRFGGRVCIPAMQVALCVTLAVFSTWQRPEDRFLLHLEVVGIFFFLRMLIGAGEIFPNAIMQQWFQRYRGRAVAIVFTFQWLGNAFVGMAVAYIVSKYSWRTAAALGSTVNLALAPASALLIRRSPEVCGMLPDGSDGYTFVPETKVMPDGDMEMEKEKLANGPDTSDTGGTGSTRFLPHFMFTFFSGLIFGGCDFYMIEMVEEAAGKDGVSVSFSIFAPVAISLSIAIPCVGELMDAYCSRKWLPAALLAASGFLTGGMTIWLTFLQDWRGAVFYGIIRGLVFGQTSRIPQSRGWNTPGPTRTGIKDLPDFLLLIVGCTKTMHLKFFPVFKTDKQKLAVLQQTKCSKNVVLNENFAFSFGAWSIPGK